MCYRTLTGVLYQCSFASITAALRGTDLLDPVDVACTIDFVEGALDGRTKEEVDGTGDLSRERAHLRLRGAVRELEKTVRRAAAHRAPPEFIGIIHDSLTEAGKALAIAEKYQASKEPTKREPMPWSTEPVPDEDDAPLHTPVTMDDSSRR